MNRGVRVGKGPVGMGLVERNTPRGIVARLHRDDAGAISLLTVFTVLGFAMLLGMVINVGKSIDGKVRRQHAADAATYTGTVILARGMNCVAFANHMLCEVFAMTAYMRKDATATRNRWCRTPWPRGRASRRSSRGRASRNSRGSVPPCPSESARSRSWSPPSAS